MSSSVVVFFPVHAKISNPANSIYSRKQCDKSSCSHTIHETFTIYFANGIMSFLNDKYTATEKCTNTYPHITDLILQFITL